MGDIWKIADKRHLAVRTKIERIPPPALRARNHLVPHLNQQMPFEVMIEHSQHAHSRNLRFEICLTRPENGDQLFRREKRIERIHHHV